MRGMHGVARSLAVRVARASPNDEGPGVVSRTRQIVVRDRCDPPALRSQSAARVRVQTVVRVTSPLNARHPPSHWLAGIGTLPLGQVAEVSSGRNPQPLLMWSGYVRVRTGAYSSPGGRRARAPLLRRISRSARRRGAA